MSIVERIQATVADARRRRPLLDHLITTVEHYNTSGGAAQAGNITYFGFLSFFPILAIAFAVVGWAAEVYPDADEAMTTALQSALPGIVGDQEGQIALSDFQGAAAAAGVIGAVGLLYSGLNWLSALRVGVQDVFDVDTGEAPGFVVGKARDLATMGALGVVLVLSVSVTGAATGAGDWLLDLLLLDDVPGTGVLLALLGVLLGVAASTVLFLSVFRLLAAPPEVPGRALLHGALFSAIGFELLKQLATLLISSVTSNPAFALFGVALVLVVWINYFARVTLLGASWAETSPLTAAARLPAQREAALVEAEQIASVHWGPEPEEDDDDSAGALVADGVKAAITFAAITLLLRRLLVPSDD